MNFSRPVRRRMLMAFSIGLAVVAGSASAIFAVCGPFTDVSDAAFCPFVLGVFYVGITTGTTPTTYDPQGNVSRLQMAAFLSRTVDVVLRRGSRRAVMKHFWIPQVSDQLAVTTLGGELGAPEFDGADVWVPSYGSSSVSRVRASDGRLLESWTGAGQAAGAVLAYGRVFVTGNTPGGGRLYRIDPAQPAGAVTTVATNLGEGSVGIAFDGSRFYTANNASGSVSIVTPGLTLPWTVSTATTGFTTPLKMLYDGANVWTADNSTNKILRIGPTGSILQTVTVGTGPYGFVFDGNNIWVASLLSPSVSIVRSSDGALLATLTGNGLTSPVNAAFDGRRVMVGNVDGTVALFKAADLAPIGSFSIPGNPSGICSDAVNFWIAITAGKLVRF